MKQPIFNTGNNFPNPSRVIGGGVPVYFEIGRELPGGFTVDLSTFPKGSVVQAATPVAVDEATRLAKVHIAVEIYENAASGADQVKIKKASGGSVLSVGQFVMPAPSSLAGTGTGYAITEVDSSNASYDILTFGANLSAAVTAGAIFVEVDKAGAGAVIKFTPNALTRHDIYVDPTSTQFTCGAVIEATVYERRVPPVIDPVKALLSEVKFSKSR